MKIKFLGTGSAFDYQLGNSAATMQTADKLFLIDCGATVYSKLREHDLVERIDYFLPTHLHGDHAGSLFQLIVHFKHRTDRKLQIIYPNSAIKAELEKYLSLNFQPAEAVELIPITEVSGVDFIDTTGQHVPNMPTVAYYFTENDELIYYSGDLGRVETTKDFLDSRSESKITVFHDISPTEGPGHVHYLEAASVLADYTVYGYHCDKAALPADNQVKLVEDYPEFLY